MLFEKKNKTAKEDVSPSFINEIEEIMLPEEDEDKYKNKGSSINQEEETSSDIENSNDSASSIGIAVIKIKHQNSLEKKEIHNRESHLSKKRVNSEAIIEQNKGKESTIKGVLLFIQVLLGICLADLSIFLFLISLKHSSSGQKIISLVLELLLLLISLYGAYPKKTISHKKAVAALYLWSILFLIPLEFFSESGIKNEEKLKLFHETLTLRLILIAVQEVLFFLALVAKIEI